MTPRAWTVRKKVWRPLQADVDLARGRLLHARFIAGGQGRRREDPQELRLFVSAAERYRSLGDERGEAESWFMVGTWHQVVGGDGTTFSYVLRHLAYIALSQDRFEDARHQKLESTHLRRDLGFTAGVAMNLIGMAEIEAAVGDRVATLGSASWTRRRSWPPGPVPRARWRWPGGCSPGCDPRAQDGGPGPPPR